VDVTQVWSKSGAAAPHVGHHDGVALVRAAEFDIVRLREAGPSTTSMSKLAALTARSDAVGQVRQEVLVPRPASPPAGVAPVGRCL